MSPALPQVITRGSTGRHGHLRDGAGEEGQGPRQGRASGGKARVTVTIPVSLINQRIKVVYRGDADFQTSTGITTVG